MPDSKPAIHRDPFAPGDDPRRRRGRKQGSRAKLAVRFFEDTYAAWEEQGESALARAAFHDPMGFVSMVARLMPQKIEVSTPTDGMSDERLAEMLDMAERMARLRSQGVATPLLAHELADENAVTLNAFEEGGGGPLGPERARGVSSTDPVTADPGRIAETPYNKLDVRDSNSTTAHDRNCSSCATPLQAHEIELCERCGAPAALPYPVGKPGPMTKGDEIAQAQRNARKLLADEDIDPESLF